MYGNMDLHSFSPPKSELIIIKLNEFDFLTTLNSQTKVQINKKDKFANRTSQWFFKSIRYTFVTLIFRLKLLPKD